MKIDQIWCFEGELKMIGRDNLLEVRNGAI